MEAVFENLCLCHFGKILPFVAKDVGGVPAINALENKEHPLGEAEHDVTGKARLADGYEIRAVFVSGVCNW